jgi:FtsP/CotA-like multicopper oxidase with cupredoxin domain
MASRRDFLKVSVVAGAGALITARFGGIQKVFALPLSLLDPNDIPKFMTPLLIPPVMPSAGKLKMRGGKNADYYEIAMRQFQQQILPASLPATTVWGYGPRVAKKGTQIFNAPSLTIEARHNTPVVVKWVNELRQNPNDPTSPYLPHLLPVDPTLHWANPPGGEMGRDMRPDFTGKTYVPIEDFNDPATQYTRYTGPVPIVSHVHGAAGVGDESDGYAEAWFLPIAGGIPAGYATEGTWYDFFRSKASQKNGVDWDPGSATFLYPNTQRASTIWYHDHVLGMTRLNVYAGPAGFYLIRGGNGGDGSVIDSRSGKEAVLPGPAPKENDKFPPNKTYYEIPIAIQDRSFCSDGSLFYPDTRELFDEFAGPYIPETEISPIWNPEFFGNTTMVNGNTWPFLNIEQRRYRFRFLNGCDSRFLILDFSSIPGVEVWQIGNEGGFLATPVNITADHDNKLLMGLAERADVIVDFTDVPPGAHILGNIGPDEPFGGGIPGVDFTVADPNTTGQVMQFRVVPAQGNDPTTPPQFLQLPAITPLSGGALRPLMLLENSASEFPEEEPVIEALLGTANGDPNTGVRTWVARKWHEPVTENPEVGDTEVWEFYNATADAHPMHVH